MGWTSFATRKNFDEVLREDVVPRDYRVEASCIKSVIPERGRDEEAEVYAAVRHPKGYVFGLVVLMFTTKEQGRREVFYKEMDESMHPFYYDCPASVLNRLSPLDKIQGNMDDAKAWREKCRLKIACEK